MIRRRILVALIVMVFAMPTTGQSPFSCDTHFTSTAVEWTQGWFCGAGCSGCICTVCCSAEENICCYNGNCG